MATLAEIRQQYPQYNALGDSDLADRLYRKFYADKIPRETFDAKIGLHTSGQLAGGVNPMAVVKPGAATDSLGGAVPDLGNEEPVPGDLGAGHALAGSIINGVPVAGPAVKSWIDDFVAGLKSHLEGGSYDQQKLAVDAANKASEKAHPIAAGVGNLIGGIAGYGGAALAAPALFGAGALPLAGRAGISALTNAGIAGADAAARDGSREDILHAGEVGMTLGGAAPVAGKIVGAIARPVARTFTNWFGPAVPGMGRAAARTLAEALATDTKVLGDVPTMMRELGPEAMLPDTGGALQGWAQGLEPKFPQIGQALRTRDQGASGRILSDVEHHYGPAGNSPLREKGLMDAEAKAEGQKLPAIFQSAPPVDASRALATIDLMLPAARGPQEAALKYIRGQLMERGVPGQHLTTDAQALHNAKVAIDNIIKYGDTTLGIEKGAISQADGAAQKIRGVLNGELRTQVPGYDAVMDEIYGIRGQQTQLKKGTEVFRSGADAVHPQDLSAEMAGLSPEEQAARRFGTRAAIDAKLRSNPNDRVALKGIVGDTNDFKRANLETTFGKDETAGVVGTAEREARFYDTKHRVADNSMTARRLSAEKAANPDTSVGSPVAAAIATFNPGSIPAYLGARAAQSAISGWRKYALSGRNAQMAKALATKDVAGLADALARQAGLPAMANHAGDQFGELARALVGYEGAVRRGRELPAPSTVGRAALGTGALIFNQLMPR